MPTESVAPKMHPPRRILGYDIGEIPAGGATTAEIYIAGCGVPLQALMDTQYKDSQTMDKQPGMYIKYLPYRYDEVTGKLLTGGSYLFDTWENAKEYGRWMVEDFRVGSPETPFLEQPMFESTVRNIWKVIGAYNFAPVEDHAIGRLQRWQCDATANIDTTLRDAYPAVLSAAKDQGAASVWLLYRPEENTVGLHLAFRKGDGATDAASVGEWLAAVAAKPSLGDVLPARWNVRPVFDRCSLFLTLWLPLSREKGGAARTIPLYPVVPAITDEQP